MHVEDVVGGAGMGFGVGTDLETEDEDLRGWEIQMVLVPTLRRRTRTWRGGKVKTRFFA